MVDTINVPAHDNFQVITKHGSDSLIYDAIYLNIPRNVPFILPLHSAASSFAWSLPGIFWDRFVV
jgi:hypothetical protein